MIKLNYVTLVWIRSRQGFIVKEYIINIFKKVEKTIAYIDGQNFLYKVAPYLIEAKVITSKQSVTAIDIPFLLQNLFPDKNIEIRYYGTKKIKKQTKYGKTIEKKTVLFADNLRRLKTCLEKTGVIFRSAGSLKVRDTDVCKKCKRSSYKLQEKGVDVGLAVDLVSDALTKQVSHIILLSSDTDLIPAINSAKQNYKVKITYVGFTDSMVRAISACTNEHKSIENDMVIEAYTRVNPKSTSKKNTNKVKRKTNANK